MVLFRLAEALDSSPHEYRVIEPDDPLWLEKLAHEYRELRTSSVIQPEEIKLDGITLVSLALLQQRIAEAAIAERRGGNFDVLRSDLGEMIMARHGTDEYGYLYGYRSIRDREMPGLPGRGIDQIGVEAPVVDTTGSPRIALVLCEAKVSSDRRSPPSVVDAAEDSLRNQHIYHIKNVEVTADKIVNAARRCTDRETNYTMLIAAELLRTKIFDRLIVICHSLIVRPASCASEQDFGTFMKSPDDYLPGLIRFIICRLPNTDLESTIDSFTQIARSAQPAEPANQGTTDDS